LTAPWKAASQAKQSGAWSRGATLAISSHFADDLDEGAGAPPDGGWLSCFLTVLGLEKPYFLEIR
jgi:hypothetical protein